MSTATFTSTPGYGETLFELLHYRQAVRVGDRAPIWTQIGVAALGAPGMRVEIRVTALVGRED